MVLQTGACDPDHRQPTAQVQWVIVHTRDSIAITLASQ